MPKLTDPEFIALAVSLAMTVLIVWAVARSWRKAVDRRSRESIRCRDCWYDLRGTTGATCPECGSKLAERGVYPPGRPRRGALLNAWAVWAGVVAIAGAAGCVVFHQNCWKVRGTQYVSLINPEQAKFVWSMTLDGERLAWPWTPDSEEVPATWKQLMVVDRPSGSSVVYVVDGNTIEVYPGIGVGGNISRSIPRDSLDGKVVVDDLVAQSGEGEREGIESRVRRAAPTLDWARRVVWMDSKERAESEYWNAHVEPVIGDLESNEAIRKPFVGKEPAPVWVIAVPASFTVLIWLIGLPLIARWWRGRNLVAWVPQQPQQPPST